MREGTFFRRLHGAALPVQVPLVLAAVPAAACVYAFAIAPTLIDAVVAESRGDAAVAARRATVATAVLLLAAVAVVTGGAALLLRGSVRSVVERLHQATSAIADGDFSHRIATTRSDEFGRLAASIDAMAERLERLEQARRRLLACVSHELRTPMTIIRGHTFTLARHEADPSRRERLELVDAEAARLARLVEDLVDASSLHAGSVQLRVERADLVEIVRDAAGRFEQQASARDVRVIVEASRRGLRVLVDPARIEQILANLLANAVRHAEAGSIVRVAVGAGRGGHERHVVVSNQGAAVPEPVAARMFEPFVQGEGPAGRLGLGLTIAAALATAHGGSLSLEDRGCSSHRVSFRLTLPPAPRLAASGASGQRRRVPDSTVGRRRVGAVALP